MAPRARCQICQEMESRYTCPASGCLIDYCSVACYKQHKGDEITKEVPLRPLTALKWPYVPDESAYPDPLKRDDPKPLQTAQYEAIATSPAIRAILREDDSGLKETLRRIDGLWGSTREEALQASLGIGRSGLGGGSDGAMRDLAEAIECAVRGKRDGVLGLDWSVDCPERE
ncbi:hypothetical protein BJV77DRAFT_946015 [Russula vinacea]|nr:hypothetical protein BJV77DRAFT_946015 [Russula vinacea]